MSTSDSSAATFRASLRSLRFRPLALPSAPVAPLRPASAAEHQTSAHHSVRTPAVFAPTTARPTAFAPLARRPEPGQTAGHRGTHALTSHVRTFFTGIKATRAPASDGYVKQTLREVGIQSRILRSTRLVDLVGTVDPKLVANIYGMTNEAVIAYLADYVDTARLPNP